MLLQSPEHADALYRLGLIEHAAGRFDNAVRYYEATLRLRPDFPDVYYNLGMTLEARGDANGAIARLGQAVRLRPDWPAALIATARVLFSHPDPASREPALAVELARRACTLTDEKDAGSLATLAAALAAASQWPEAVSVAEKGLVVAEKADDRAMADSIRENLARYRAGTQATTNPTDPSR